MRFKAGRCALLGRNMPAKLRDDSDSALVSVSDRCVNSLLGCTVAALAHLQCGAVTLCARIQQLRSRASAYRTRAPGTAGQMPQRLASFLLCHFDRSPVSSVS